MPQSKRTFSGVLGGILGLVGLSAVAGLLVTAAVTPAIALSGYTASGAITMFENIPADLQVDRPMLPTTLYAKDSNGKDRELATFYDQNRIPLEYEDLPQVVIDAVLSSEDPRFYDHGGVDLFGTGRALISNAAGGATQGASTISQQFVKNVLVQRCEAGTSEDLPDDFADLSAEDQDKAITECYYKQTDSSGTEGYQRKLQEMRYAIAIEKTYTKEQILLGYLNIANFGGQTYGIEAASERYLNKHVKDLNVGEAATLAGIVQNPNQLRIDMPGGTMKNSAGEWINTEKSGYSATKKRQQYVLRRMAEDDKITQEQYDKYIDAPITPDVQTRSQGCQQADGAAYFCQYVTNVILNDEAFGETADERRQTLRRGGLKVYTTLNPDIQSAAETAMKTHAPKAVDGMNYGAAAVTVDPRTGDILAMAQNTDYTQSAERAKTPGYTGLVYAADKAHGGAIGFSAGSTYKLFTLVDWLENGRSVRETIDGTRRDFPFFCGSDSKGTYDSGNFGGGNGSIGTPMSFTSSSLNSGFLAMASQLDLCEINRVAERMGVTVGNGDSTTKDNYPSDILGNKNIAPLDLASAYGTVANNGKLCDQRAIRKVVDPDGKEMTLPKHECKKAIEPGVAATAAYALQGVMNGGTGAQGNPYDGTPLIGKTGTHEDLQTMLVESSTRAATAVWSGNASGNGSIFGHGLQNIRYGLGRDIQAAANASLGSDPFPEPDSDLTRVVMKDVPNVSGMSVDAAVAAIEDAGFTARVGDPTTGTQPQGTVQHTEPSGSAPTGSVIMIRPSDGRGVGVPNVAGMSLSEARGAIQSAGLNPATGSCQADDGVSGQQATSTNPGSGAVVTPGATVTIHFRSDSCGGGDDDKKKKSDEDDTEKKPTKKKKDRGSDDED